MSWIGLPKRSEMPTPCGGRCLKAKPGVGLEVEGDDGISAIGLQVSSRLALQAADQPPTSLDPPWPSRQMAAQLFRFAQGPDPEQSAESSFVDDQMQRLT